MGKKQREADEPRAWRETSVFAGGPGQKWTGPASVILIAVLLVVSGVVLFWPHPTDAPDGTTDAPDASVSASAVPSPSDANESVLCPPAPLEAGDVNPPADLGWTAQYGNSWPVSAAVGPRRDIDGIGHCYARSPIGAALAAVNATQAARTGDIDTALRVASARFVQDEGTEAYKTQVVKVFSSSPPETRPVGRVMGYRIVSFTPDEARVLLVESRPQYGQYTGYTFTMRWVDGDWLVELTNDGQSSPDGQITVDPNGYTAWVAKQ